MADRPAVRCPYCHLRQFQPTTDHCRRCRRSLQPAPVTLSTLGTTLSARGQSALSCKLRPHGVVPPSFDICIAWVLKVLRLAHGYSQNQLAVRCGCQRSYISKIESGRVTPSIDSLVKYTVALEIPIVVLIHMIEFVAKEAG